MSGGGGGSLTEGSGSGAGGGVGGDSGGAANPASQSPYNWWGKPLATSMPQPTPNSDWSGGFGGSSWPVGNMK